MQEGNKSQHILALAEEIIAGIESNKLPAKSLVLKATRLANLAGSEKTQIWLSHEKNGYITETNPISGEFLNKTGRITNNILGKKIWYGALGVQQDAIDDYKIRLEHLKTNPEPQEKTLYSNPKLNPPRLDRTLLELMSVHQNIVNRVTNLIHEFATSVYYKSLFSEINENIFENFKVEVDKLLGEKCGDVLQKIPSIYKRLSEGDLEAVSQALTTCRRIIDSFADSIYPPSDKQINMDGNLVNLTAQNYLNRINAYIRERTESKSRRIKFRQSLTNLYNRVSAGVHSEVSLAEARSLFLETYLLLGEIISLKK